MPWVIAWCVPEWPTGSTGPTSFTGTAETGEESARTAWPVPEGELERPSGLGAEGAPPRRGPYVHDVGLGGQRQGHIEQEAGGLEVGRGDLSGAGTDGQVQDQREHPQDHGQPGGLTNHPMVGFP